MKKLQQGEGNEGRLVSGSMWSEDTRRGWSELEDWCLPHCSLASCQSLSAPPPLPSQPRCKALTPASLSLKSSPNLLPCPVSVSTDSNMQVLTRHSLFPPQIFPNYLVLDTGLRDTDSRQEAWRPQSRALTKQVQCQYY